jgi:hypothetical protein
VATEDLGDPATADRLRDQAVAATKSVDQVRLYAKTTCGVDLLVAGLPATPEPSTVPGATTTTIPPNGSATTAAPTTPAPTPPPTLPGTVPPTVP